MFAPARPRSARTWLQESVTWPSDRDDDYEFEWRLLYKRPGGNGRVGRDPGHMLIIRGSPHDFKIRSSKKTRVG